LQTVHSTFVGFTWSMARMMWGLISLHLPQAALMFAPTGNAGTVASTAPRRRPNGVFIVPDPF
jgi:hypothetical protein